MTAVIRDANKVPIVHDIEHPAFNWSAEELATLRAAQHPRTDVAPETPTLLYATKDLSFVLLPPGYASPSLHRDEHGNARWFWRCDLAFLSWMEGVALVNAKKLTPVMVRAMDRVRCHVYHHAGITDDTTHLIPKPGGKLPTELFADTLSLYDAHCGPNWKGMAECARALGVSTVGCEASRPDRRGDWEPPTRLRGM